MDRLIELNRLPPAEAQAVLDEVLALDERIFVHTSKEVQDRFYQGVRNLAVGEKVVVLYREEDTLIGFNLITIVPIELGGRTVWTVGSLAGFLPGHTGGNRTMLDAIRAMILHKLRHPARDLRFVSFLVNPAGYDMVVELCPSTYPSPRCPLPRGDEAALLATLARKRGAQILAEEPGRLVITMGRSSREAFERRRDTENIRFFEALNPRYAEGELLGVCVPLGLGDLLGGALRLARRRLRKSRSAKD